MLRFDFGADSANQVAEVPADVQPTVLFGVRPCEARSLALLDRVFLGQEYQDPYYAQRREATAIVALGCTSAAPTCFCTTVGGAPDDHTGADLFLYPDDGGFVVDVVTDRGEALLAGFDLPEADAQTIERAERSARETADAIPKLGGLERIGPDAISVFDDPSWEAVAQRCLGCAACAYLCPTCHCFDIQDEVLDEQGRRVRNWDCCMFPVFTLHASGHNPRDERQQRVRQRMMHKFVYFVENFGAAACVGCGRCVRVCPAGNDIRRWLRTLADACAHQTSNAGGQP
jgi:ferredoxin